MMSGFGSMTIEQWMTKAWSCKEAHRPFRACTGRVVQTTVGRRASDKAERCPAV
jgi:hypothetical protein